MVEGNICSYETVNNESPPTANVSHPFSEHSGSPFNSLHRSYRLVGGPLSALCGLTFVLDPVIQIERSTGPISQCTRAHSLQRLSGETCYRNGDLIVKPTYMRYALQLEGRSSVCWHLDFTRSMQSQRDKTESLLCRLLGLGLLRCSLSSIYSETNCLKGCFDVLILRLLRFVTVIHAWLSRSHSWVVLSSGHIRFSASAFPHVNLCSPSKLLYLELQTKYMECYLVLHSVVNDQRSTN